MYDVIAIGSVTRDVFFDASGLSTVPWKKTQSGRGIVLPLGDKIEAKEIYFTIGGNSANASVTFSRQDFNTACVGRVGRDVAGSEILNRLKKEKVYAGMISSDNKLPTAYSVLLLKNGERTILSYHGSSNDFSLDDFKLGDLKAKWWYLSLAGSSYKMYGKLLSYASREKIAVAFNPSGYHLKMDKKGILSSLKHISFLVLNEEEAAILTGIPFSNERAVFKKLDAIMPGVLAVTNGSEGVTVSDGHFVYRASTFKEKKLADRTGAGDAFGSGFVAGLMKDGINLSNISRISEKEVKEAIIYASANATSVVEHVGATEGILTARELKMPRWRNLRIRIEKL
ncbi:carbohydrate kinase family protein [Patescibacteria group bacterium]|nr:carbohydrate kinase family protein [Patescibacteria group bacterium]